MWDKLQDHPDHVLTREKSQQLADEAAVSGSGLSDLPVGLFKILHSFD